MESSAIFSRLATSLTLRHLRNRRGRRETRLGRGYCEPRDQLDSRILKLLKLNPFAPGDFFKTRFEASRVVFWSLSCYKELKLTTNRFTGRTLHGLLIQMQNISLRSSGMRRKQNFDSFGLKVTQQSRLLLFAFSPPLFFRFSCLIFFFLLLGI